MAFAGVEEEFKIGDSFETSVLFKESSHLTRAALEEDESVSFTTVGNGSKENDGALEVR